ncbi:MAG: class II aldolase/adducin family protein [Flavobacteriales bacterium]|nr:class II aldolase/adducin family protein [Flavobacteriales bacterium]MCB9363712.1 class II aldolase/adducin family protein [Flavobacteriales bacterium]
MSNQNNFIDEGYIKYNINWINEPLKVTVPNQLMEWRDKMHELKQIGHYAEINIGYGNISVKTNEGFLISGTQTGDVYPIQPKDFTLVTDYNIQANSVTCKGEIKASSESMTHAAVYEADSSIKAIIHIHNPKLWNLLMDKVPTTKKEVPYGTPEMANEIFRLFKETKVKEEKIIVMAGHDEGIISFGTDLNEAGEVLLNFLAKFN